METLALETLKKILGFLKIPVSKINVQEEKSADATDAFITLKIDIESEEGSLLIGYHGESIQALQHVLKTILRHQADEGSDEERYKIQIDVDDYRKRQEDSVVALAKRKAEMVRETKRPQILPPMSPYFRRLIHLHFKNTDYPDLETESIGENDRRQVVIKLKDNTD